MRIFSAKPTSTLTQTRALRKRPPADWARRIIISKGDLIFHDTYFGVRDFIGSEIIYKSRNPVGGMNYYGVIVSEQTDEKTLYGFLRDALMQAYGDLIPVRGPRLFRANERSYTNAPDGEISQFTGSEEIHNAGQLVYRAFYHGGLLK